MATSDIQAMQDGTPGTLGERVDALSGRVDTLGERVTRMETRMEYLATKEDVANIKVWVLVGRRERQPGGAGPADDLPQVLHPAMTGAGGAVGGVVAGPVAPVLAAGGGRSVGPGETVALSDRERITALETRMEYLATKEDIAELKAEIVGIKVWVLVGVVSGSLAALGLLMTYHRFFILP